MLNRFEVSQNINEDYTYSYQFEDNLVFNYQHEHIFNIVNKNDMTIACYGYCFDTREPKTTTLATLDEVLEQNNFEEDIKYLNGHYILLYNISGEWKLSTDAVSITPVYVDSEKKLVFSSSDEEEVVSLNSNIELNLKDFTFTRMEKPTNKLADERIERIILDAVKNQYKYFEDKDLTINFRRNKMNKALISILYRALRDKALNLRQKDEISLKVGKWLERDYQMHLMEQEEPSSDYICNVHLMDYQAYRNNEVDLSEDELEQFREEGLLKDEETTKWCNIEYNLKNNLKYRQEDKPQLIFDPFNVRIIQECIYHYDDIKTFNPLNRIIKILHPIIDFYDFASGMTLSQKYDRLLASNKKLKEEARNSIKNFEFIQEAKEEGIKLSNNLGGQLQEKGITVYPASIQISKDDIFEIEYTKKGHGLVLLETFFDNPKNAHRIKIELNEEVFNINEFMDGKFINVESTLRLKMYYERDYNAASWQKAGRIMIKEID
ncbi:hypothetical protein [Salinicoccus halodurans]|uniref:Uncharacterized protein n=1 Tax=Salinicoccus halodurans TaxID=407035 RepID=A0A0F7D410_9STAP|nr:hypothetical protein [Salinicoccus halodurans]AKG73420.1 hypothetical protein AAT16_03810 [Salinicoccus halodurans]SFK80952.1 hypothetical protein SAMN05216235_1758 [Salinicoccus halodurans]